MELYGRYLKRVRSGLARSSVETCGKNLHSLFRESPRISPSFSDPIRRYLGLFFILRLNTCKVFETD